MPDWSKSMQQTYEYYIVDPNTWKDTKKLEMVKSCTINRDFDSDTLGSATLDITGNIGENYIRVYLITIQNGVKEKFPLGTYLVQTPSKSFDGKTTSVSLDAYTPLLELKENPTTFGYAVLKDSNIMDIVYRLTVENLRAPVVKTTNSTNLYADFIADPNDTWLSFNSALMANAKYSYDLDEMGRVLFAPEQKLESLQHVWTYNTDNSSILYPEVEIKEDIYGIPNVVEIIYSIGAGSYYARAVNDNPNSPISTVNRGREITYRDTNPTLTGIPSQRQLDEYAERLLKSLSIVECSISYTHGYCPVRVNDCVLLDYPEAGLHNVKAKVVSQSIKCSSGCPVSERAVFQSNLWEV